MNLTENLNSIRFVVDCELVNGDIGGTIEIGNRLSSIIGLSAECKAEAQRRLDNAKKKVLIAHKDEKLPASILSELIKTSCADEMADYVYSDRLNAAVTHKMDYVRSLISLHKEEMSTSIP